MIQSFEADCMEFDSVPEVVAIAKSRLRGLKSITPEHRLSQLGVDLRNDGRLNGIQISKAPQDDNTFRDIRCSLLKAGAENIAFRFPDRDLHIITAFRTLFDPKVLGNPGPYPASYSSFFKGEDVPGSLSHLDPASSPFSCLQSHFQSLHVSNSRAQFRPLPDPRASSPHTAASHASSSAAPVPLSLKLSESVLSSACGPCLAAFDPFQSFSSEQVDLEDPIQQLTNPETDFDISQLHTEYPVFIKLYCKDCAREIQGRRAIGSDRIPSIVDMASNFMRKPDLVRAFPTLATVFEVSLAICVTTVNCERGFSHMKLFMPYLRNRTSPEKVFCFLCLHLLNISLFLLHAISSVPVCVCS